MNKSNEKFIFYYVFKKRFSVNLFPLYEQIVAKKIFYFCFECKLRSKLCEYHSSLFAIVSLTNNEK